MSLEAAVAPRRRHGGPDDPIYGPLAAAERVETLVNGSPGTDRLRAFTLRIGKRGAGTLAENLFAIARRFGWYGFWGHPETDEYECLVFVDGKP